MKYCLFRRKIVIAMLLLLYLTPVFSQAALVPAIRVTSDYFPTHEYELGFDLNQQNLIEQIYFQNSDHEQFLYTLKDLQRFVTIFRVSFIKLVKLRIVSMDSRESALIEMQYVHSYVSGKKMSLFFSVKLNPFTHQYDVIDQRTGQVIHEVIAKTNFSGAIPIGIAEIQTE